jgi:hypothetical protein
MIAQTPAWPVQTFKISCTATATGLSTGATYKMGIYTTNYTTAKTGGNPPSGDITYNSNPPGHRFKVVGPAQGGTPANITTNSGRNNATMFRTGIRYVSSITVPFDLYYTTYEADYGGTSYSQPFRVRIYTNSALVATSPNPADTLTFTIVNRSDLTISMPPTVNLPQGLVFTSGQDQDSNTITVSVYANNTWLLQTMLTGDLISGSNTIPVTSNYFRASGSGFINNALQKTQFATTYKNVAQNSAGIYRTGISANQQSLTSVNVSVTYNLRTINFFNAGTYTTPTTFRITCPYP